MRVAIIVICSATLLLPGFGQAGSVSECSCDESVFSNVRHVVEVDDYVGTEITLCRCKGSTSVMGVWREYEGGHVPAIVKLHGELKKGKLHLIGATAQGVATVDGILTSKSLNVKLSWRMGESSETRTLNLRKSVAPIRPPS
jgi:hypothetical protein